MKDTHSLALIPLPCDFLQQWFSLYVLDEIYSMGKMIHGKILQQIE